MVSQCCSGPSGPWPPVTAASPAGWNLGALTSFPGSPEDGAESVALRALETPSFSISLCLRMVLPPFRGPAVGPSVCWARCP